MKSLLLASLLVICGVALATPERVVVRGLFKGAALFEIDGRQCLLKNGQTDRSGLKLITADSQKALIELAGKRQNLTLNALVGGSYQAAEKTAITLHRNLRSEYRASVRLNGRSVDAIVDTGANLLAMSAQRADSLGIAYEHGTPTRVSTASGEVAGHRIVLDKVELAGIVRHHVMAVVVSGRYPRDVLLGMSFLEHLNMQEQDNILTLSPRF